MTILWKIENSSTLTEKNEERLLKERAGERAEGDPGSIPPVQEWL